MTVAELSRRMSGREFLDWQTYYVIEPFGQWRDDYHAGMISSIVANVNRKAGSKPYSPEDFMLKIKTPETMKAKESLLKAQLGHLVKR